MSGPDETAPSAADKFAHYGLSDSDLSQVIIRFAEPMLKYCTSYAAREEAISYAIFGWNLSLEDAAGAEASLQELFARLPEEKRAEIDALISYLRKRKQAEFADNRFMIVDYQLIRQGEAMKIEMTTKYIPRK